MTTEQTVRETPLASNLTLRPARWDDAQAVADLVLAVCTADGDPIAAQTTADMERFWKSDDFIRHRRVGGGNRQRADHWLRGVLQPAPRSCPATATFIRISAAGASAHFARRRDAPPGVRCRFRPSVVLRNMMSAKDKVGRDARAGRLWAIRYSWRMEIKLNRRCLDWPSGVDLRPFDRSSMTGPSGRRMSRHFPTTGVTHPHIRELTGQISGGDLILPLVHRLTVRRWSVTALCRYRQGIGFRHPGCA
jgi:hypothetical protein